MRRQLTLKTDTLKTDRVGKREGMSWVTGVGPKEKERRPRTGGKERGLRNCECGIGILRGGEEGWVVLGDGRGS